MCFACPAFSWLSRRNFRAGERGRWHILCSVQPHREWQACCWLYPKPEYILEWLSRWRERGGISVEIKSQSVYCVVFCVLKYASFEEARTEAPDDIAAHVRRSRELHENGTLLMAGAFLDESDEPLSTMAVTTSREAAEEYVRGDPFFLNGMMSTWYTRQWTNMFA